MILGVNSVVERLHAMSSMDESGSVLHCARRPYISVENFQRAGIIQAIAARAEDSWQFEQSTWASGPVDADSFYEVPSEASWAAPGSLLNVEISVDPGDHIIPPSTALDRILFQTRTLNGTTVPASAYVLAPYSPRTQADGRIPVVAWAHGTSGLFGNQAPSHLKGLSAQFAAPFILALQGYVVIAPDYAGLGVIKNADGRQIMHEFLANPAHANDVFYAIQAAQAAFSRLSQQFVIFGHSQGDGAAWAAAEKQAVEPVEGYLGAIATAPVTNLLNLPSDGPVYECLVTCTLYTLKQLYPSFDYNDILTPEAARR